MEGSLGDHVSFAEVGIPAELFIHDPSETWYLYPDDTIDKILKEKLQDVARIAGTVSMTKQKCKRNTETYPKKGNKHRMPQLYFKQDIRRT